MSKYTPEQLQAINTDGMDILVSAAAGSGKTAVLVERIMRLITKNPDPVDIDKLLVVTFTEAAAGEMRSRISDALNAKLRESPRDANLKRQIGLLSLSSIMTIHAFCLRVVRRFFSSLDIDPGFRIADNTEKRLIKSQVLAMMFEEEYAAGDADFFCLAESYGGGRTDDSGMEDLVLDIYEFISSSPWPERWLNEAAEMFADPLSSPWMDVIRDGLIRNLSSAKDSAERAIAICMTENGPEKYITALRSDIAFIDSVMGLLGEGSFDELCMERIFDLLSGFKSARMAAYTVKNRGDVSLELIERVKYIRKEQVKEVISNSAKIFIKPPRQMFEDVAALKKPVEKLKNLVLDFMRLYREEKKERNLLDFNDLEHYCLEILLDGEKPSLAAKQLGEGFYEVLIDEYQDSNWIQELILSSLGVKRFMVGDVKQSIYKFRHAMPEIFLGKYKNPQGAAVIDLSKNFRSRSCVLDAVNLLFERLMKEDTGGIEYDARAWLYYGADYPDIEKSISRTTELTIINASKPKDADITSNTEKGDTEVSDDKDGSAEETDIDSIVPEADMTSTELEAEYIAARILELTGSDGLNVWDNKERAYRPARYGDIAVLVRSARASAGVISDVLSRHGIPAHSRATGGFLNAPEVKIAIGLLQIIDNPRQDIHLLAVLCSPIYMLSPDELIAIRRPNKCFFDCVASYISDPQAEPDLVVKLEKFFTDLERWRNLAVYTPIDELLDIVYEDSGFIDYAAAMSQGSVRIGNLRILRERAAQFEETSYRGLFHFMRYMEKAQNEQIEMDDAKLMSENDDLVRILTIHGSKGLEFPIVFVSGLGREFNAEDGRKAVITHQQLGFGPCYVDLENRVRSRTLPQIALSMSLKDESLAEELRVLYVAATRAREKLILTGCVKGIANKLIKWDIYAGGDLPAHYILTQNNFLDWIAPALLKTVNPRLDIKLLNSEDILQAGISLDTVSQCEELSGDKNNGLVGVQELSFAAQENIIKALEWKYPRTAESELPVKVTISEIKRRYQAEILTDKVIHITADEKSLQISRSHTGGVKTGTAMHTVMEHIDLHRHRTASAINELVNSLIETNLLDTEARIDIARICTFVNSPLADRIRASKYVRTESPFVMEIDPKEAFGASHKNLDARILLHGIIDCFFEEDDGFVLIDYKSDFATHNRIPEIVGRYKLQLSLYARAIEARFGKPVKESLLYLFAIDEAVVV